MSQGISSDDVCEGFVTVPVGPAAGGTGGKPDGLEFGPDAGIPGGVSQVVGSGIAVNISVECLTIASELLELQPW